MGSAIVSRWMGSLLIAAAAWWPAVAGAASEAQTTLTTQPVTAPAPTADPAPEEQPEIKPRFELYVPSLENLAAETRRSNTGFLATHLGSMLVELGSISSEGVDVESAVSLLERIRD